MRKSKFLLAIALVFVATFIFLMGHPGSHKSLKERIMLKRCKIDRSHSNLDENNIKIVEKLASSVISWEDDERLTKSYPWSDVTLSILQYPDSVKFSSDTCDICNRQTLVDLYFKSPSFTWQKMCGSAGNMTICTNCKKQVKFIMTMCN